MRKSMILGLALAGIVMALLEPAAAAPRWGPLKKVCAAAKCHLAYSAILWDIPWGQSWYSTCMQTSHPTLGRRPTFCENNIVNMWGNWVVLDPAGAKQAGCQC